MPSQTETPVQAYAHCVNPRCRGNEQQAVDAVAVETSFSFQETGGDGMFGHAERTMDSLRFADPEEFKCEFCGGNRDLSAQTRMQLDDSGYDPTALLDIAPEKRYDPKTQREVAERLKAEDESKRDDEIQALRESNAEMRGMMQALLAQGQPAAVEPADPTPEELDD